MTICCSLIRNIWTALKHTEQRIMVTYFVSDVLHLFWNIFKLGLNSSPFDRFQFFALPIRPPSNIFSGSWNVLEQGKEENQTWCGVNSHYSKNKFKYSRCHNLWDPFPSVTHLWEGLKDYGTNCISKYITKQTKLNKR